jgi:Flp pilus assembly protein TadD
MALVVRLVAALQEARSVFFGFPILDERYYEGAARALLGLSGGVPLDGFRALGYPAFLALFVGLAGPEGGVVAATLAQHLVGVATGVLVALTARRWGDGDAAGLAAGALWALAGPPVFFEGQLLAETLFTFLMALQIWLVTGGQGMPRRALAGGVTGLLARVRPNGLLLAGAYALALLWEKGRRRILVALAALAALVAVQLGGSVLEVSWTGRWVPLAGSGGVNLYLGNERQADGLVPRQDVAVPAGEAYRDSVQVWSEVEFARDRPGERVTPAAVSRYWVGRALDEVAACPTCWLRLMGRKALALVAAVEVPNHRSYAFTAREELPLLRWLPVRWWLLVALAPLGLAVMCRAGRRGQAAWGLAFGALHALGVVLFFVNSRYRLPLWPLGCVWAGIGWCDLVARARARRWRSFGLGLAGASLLASVSWSAALALPVSADGRDHFYRSLARHRRGLDEEALADARKAVASRPEDPAYRVQVGNLLLALDRPGEAVRTLAAAVDLDPAQPIAHNNLGIALERVGDIEGARTAYRAALRQAPVFAPARENLALLELSQGRVDAAREAMRGAADPARSNARHLAVAGLLALAEGDCERGEWLLAAGRDLDRELVESIVSATRGSGRWPPGVC